MTEIKVLIEWLDAICEEAKTAGQRGDASKANALARNGTLRYYFNNVYMLNNVSRATFGAVGAYVEEVDRLYHADMAAREADRKLQEAETITKAQGEQIAGLLETTKTQQEQINKLLAFFDEQAAKIAKPAKKPKTEPAAEVETQDQLDTEAE